MIETCQADSVLSRGTLKRSTFPLFLVSPQSRLHARMCGRRKRRLLVKLRRNSNNRPISCPDGREMPMCSAASAEAPRRNAWARLATKLIPIRAAWTEPLGSDLPPPPEAPPAASPSSKLGFAFEMSFPMSARTTD